MKNLKFFLFVVMASAMMACNTNEPKQVSKTYTGNIVGTLGCYDEETGTIFYKGYFIETNDKDTVLSFNICVEDSIDVRYGTYTILPIKIPYPFTLTILDLNDKQYIHYVMPIEDAMHQPITTPINEINQVIINPCK